MGRVAVESDYIVILQYSKTNPNRSWEVAFRLERRLDLHVQNYQGSCASWHISRAMVTSPTGAFSFIELMSRACGSREETNRAPGTLLDSGLVSLFQFDGRKRRACLSPLPPMRHLPQQAVIARKRRPVVPSLRPSEER